MSAEPSRGVVVALEAPANLELVAIAAAVARSLALRLDALLLEDERLLAAAALPFTRELVPGRRAPSAFDPAGLAHSLHAEGERLRKVIRAEAEAAGVAWSLRIVRTDREQVIAQNAIVVIAAGGTTPLLPPLLTPAKPRRRVVLITQAGEPVGEQTARIAARLARRSGMVLHVLVAGGDRVDLHPIEAGLQAIVAAEGTEATFTRATTDLLAALRELRPGVVAVGRDGGASLAEELADHLRCPLLLVRESGMTTART